MHGFFIFLTKPQKPNRSLHSLKFLGLELAPLGKSLWWEFFGISIPNQPEYRSKSKYCEESHNRSAIFHLAVVHLSKKLKFRILEDPT
jgi:hypothetical protein